MNNNKGFILIVIIFLIIILSSIIIASLKISRNNIFSSFNREKIDKSFHLTISGINYTDYLLKNNLISGDTEIHKTIYDVEGKIFGEIKINIQEETLTVTGIYNNFTDTAIGNIIFKQTSDNLILHSENGINLFDTGLVVQGGIHSNSNINYSSNIQFDTTIITSVDEGQQYLPLPNINYDSYIAYLNNNGISYTGDTAFLENRNYSGLYYIDGNVTIGGPIWWDNNWNYRQGLVFSKPAGYESLDYSMHHYYLQLDFLSEFTVPIDNIDLNSIRIIRNNIDYNKGTELPYQIIESADNSGSGNIDYLEILILIHQNDLRNTSETEVVYYLYFDTIENGPKPAPIYTSYVNLIPANLRIDAVDFSGNNIYRARVNSTHGYLREYINYLGSNNANLIIAKIFDYNPWRQDYTNAGAVSTILLNGSLLVRIRTTKTIGNMNIIRTYDFYPQYYTVNIRYRLTGGAVSNTSLRMFHSNEFNNSIIYDNSGQWSLINGAGDDEGRTRNFTCLWYGVYKNTHAYSMSRLYVNPINNWLEYWDNVPGGDIEHWGAVGPGRETINLNTWYEMDLAYKYHPGQASFVFAQNDYNIFNNPLVLSYKKDGGTKFNGTLFSEETIRITGLNKNIITNNDNTLPVIICRNNLISTLTQYDTHIHNKFHPSDLSNLAVWFDASDLMLNNDETIHLWNDRSSNNHNAEQTEINRRPILKTNIINKKPVVRFDGINDYLLSNFITDLIQPNTVFTVWSKSGGNATNEKAIDGIEINKRHALYHRAGNIDLHTVYTDPGLVLRYGKAAPFSPIINTGIFNTINSRLYENGILRAIGSVGNQTLNGLLIGASTRMIPYTDFLNGDIAEILIYNTLLSNQDRIKVESYLSEKYNIGNIPNPSGTKGWTNMHTIEGLVFVSNNVYLDNLFLEGSIIANNITFINTINLNFFHNSNVWDNNLYKFINLPYGTSLIEGITNIRRINPD